MRQHNNPIFCLFVVSPWQTFMVPLKNHKILSSWYLVFLNEQYCTALPYGFSLDSITWCPAQISACESFNLSLKTRSNPFCLHHCCTTLTPNIYLTLLCNGDSVTLLHPFNNRSFWLWAWQRPHKRLIHDSAVTNKAVNPVDRGEVPTQ